MLYAISDFWPKNLSGLKSMSAHYFAFYTIISIVYNIMKMCVLTGIMYYIHVCVAFQYLITFVLQAKYVIIWLEQM